MASKQKHDLGRQKRIKNKLVNPAPLTREQRIERRIADHSRDYITAIDIDRHNGLKY